MGGRKDPEWRVVVADQRARPGRRPQGAAGGLGFAALLFLGARMRPGIELLLKVIPADNILFASEVVGAVRGIDPETGHYYDDTKWYIDSIEWLSAEDREKIFHGNARKVYGCFEASRRKAAGA